MKISDLLVTFYQNRILEINSKAETDIKTANACHSIINAVFYDLENGISKGKEIPDNWINYNEEFFKSIGLESLDFSPIMYQCVETLKGFGIESRQNNHLENKKGYVYSLEVKNISKD